MRAAIWIQLASSVIAFAGAISVGTAGWRGPVIRTTPSRFDRGFSGTQIGSIGSSTLLYPRKWYWGWILLSISFLLQMVAGVWQLISK